MPSAFTSEFASVGLIGLYATYVVLVFDIVREFIGSEANEIPYEHMNDVDDLLELCQNLLLARQVGDLVLEESIFCELIEIFRSTERLIEATKEKPEKDDDLDTDTDNNSDTDVDNDDNDNSNNSVDKDVNEDNKGQDGSEKDDESATEENETKSIEEEHQNQNERNPNKYEINEKDESTSTE